MIVCYLEEVARLLGTIGYTHKEMVALSTYDYLLDDSICTVLNENNEVTRSSNSENNNTSDIIRVMKENFIIRIPII